MTCAGYLLLNNHKIVYVTLESGILTCTDVPRLPGEEIEHDNNQTHEERSNPIEEEDNQYENNQHTSLPLLESRSMIRSDSPMENKKNGIEKTQRFKKTIRKNRVSFERVFPLSGHLLEVLEDEQEFDIASSPYSFQVNTLTLYRDSNGNETTRFVDSLILSACDQKAKDLWVQFIRDWPRHGWKRTHFVHAKDKHRAFLEYNHLQLQKKKKKHHQQATISTVASVPAATRAAVDSFHMIRPSPLTRSNSGGASGRRRFYRTAITTISTTEQVSSSSWFHARVTRVNVGAGM